MKKCTMFILLAAVLYSFAACGSNENGTAAYNGGDDPSVEAAPTPTPTPTPAPTPGGAPTLPGIGGGPPGGGGPGGPGIGLPGLPGMGVAEAPEMPSVLPEPAAPLALPINRRIVSAGDTRSAVIAEDGSLWVMGGFVLPDPLSFAFTVLQGLLDGSLTAYTPGGDVFEPDGSISGGGINFYLQCRNTQVRHNVNALGVFGPDGPGGERFTFESMLRTALENAEAQMQPGQFAENAAGVFVHMGGWFGFAHIDGDGTLYAFGDYPMAENTAHFLRSHFHLGSPPGQVSTAYGVLLDDGTLYLVDGAGDRHYPISGKVIAAEAGSRHMLMLSYDHQLWGMGSGPAVGVLGQDADSPPSFLMEDVAQIAAGMNHSMALTKDGRLYTWGENQMGQLGNRRRGTEPRPVFIMDNVAAIAAGHEHSFAITADGRLWGWGCNRFGQLGIGTPLHMAPAIIMEDVVAVSGGVRHSLAVTGDGILWGWGNNANGQLGDGTLENRDRPIQIMTGVAVP